MGGKPIGFQDTENVDPLEGNQPIREEDTENEDKENVMPHLGIEVPPGVVKEGVRNKDDEVYMIAENDDDDDKDNDEEEYDIDRSDVGAAAGAPGVTQNCWQKNLVCICGSLSIIVLLSFG